MSFSDYPKVKPPLRSVSLKEPHPVWLLDPRGVIRAANLMAFWLWEANSPGKAFQPDTLLNKSVFNVITANLKRIPVKENNNFYEKKSAVVKRMDAGLHSPLYTPFIAAMESDPQLKHIFDSADPNPDREWEYLLRILSPKGSNATELLEFRVTIYRLAGDKGLLVDYVPIQGTLSLMEKQYMLLINKYGDEAYIQSINREQDNLQDLINLTAAPRAYYPSLLHDLLWNITDTNETYLLLLGESFVGRHFFDMLFSPRFREWQGPLYDTAALRAIKYFDILTTAFQHEDHEQHNEYVLTMSRLLQLPDFRRLLEISRKIPIHINLPENFEVPFYTCRVLLPWPVSYEVTLQFRSMAQLIHKEKPDHKNVAQDLWNVVLVPENYETEVALIFMNLARTFIEPTNVGNIEKDQFLWGLAVMQTVEEGILRREEDVKWQPRSAFKRFRKKLDVEFNNALENSLQEVIVRIRVIIETMDKTGVLDKERLLNMLIDLISSNNPLGRLKQFLIDELRIHKEIEVHLGETEVLRGNQEMEEVMSRDLTNDIQVEVLDEDELKTVVFDDEEEYVRFTDYIFEEFGGEGLTFTDIPIVTSVRITPQLFEETQGQFEMQLVPNEDLRFR